MSIANHIYHADMLPLIILIGTKYHTGINWTLQVTEFTKVVNSVAIRKNFKHTHSC